MFAATKPLPARSKIDSNAEPRASQDELKIRDNRYLTLAWAFCILFGLALILNVSAASDGTWFWYATLFRQGTRLYSQLHLVLQPLFVLETAFVMGVFGNGWLASKIPAVLHLLVYSGGLALVTGEVSDSDKERALLLLTSFGLTIMTIAYRLDDYHVFAESCQLCALLILLRLLKSGGESVIRRCGFLGVLCALTFTTRPNDGLALFAAEAVLLASFSWPRRLLAFLVLSGTGAVSVYGIVRLTGESFSSYWYSTVTRASQLKGGSGHLLLSPFQLPWEAAKSLFADDAHKLIMTAFFGVVCSLVAWAWPLSDLFRSAGKAARAVLVVLALCALGRLVFPSGLKDTRAFLSGVSCAAVLGLVAMTSAVVIRYVRRRVLKEQSSDEEWAALLLLVPLFEWGSNALSSGGKQYEVYGPLAIMVLLVPMLPKIKASPRLRRTFYAGAMLVAALCLSFRTVKPYVWWNFRSGPLFQNREWFRHPAYGPTYISRDQLTFITGICQTIEGHPGNRSLLSIPYAYANYFCVIPPWHDTVQTWYDTAGQDVINPIRRDLQSSPPAWLLYEREPDAISIHEAEFRRGQRSPQALLDQDIERKLASGEWHVVKTSHFDMLDPKDQWLLISTEPASAAHN